MPETSRRALRGLRYFFTHFRSFIIVEWYRALYRDFVPGKRVRLGRGVFINVIRGGSLRIGDRSFIGNNVEFVAEGEISIGSDAFIGSGTIIASKERISIGPDALIAAYVTIRDQDHGFDRLDLPFRMQTSASSGVSIGANVWLGTKSTILRGVTIGENVIVGANAVVTSDIPANCIVAGIPARILKRLDR